MLSVLANSQFLPAGKNRHRWDGPQIISSGSGTVPALELSNKAIRQFAHIYGVFASRTDYTRLLIGAVGNDYYIRVHSVPATYYPQLYIMEPSGSGYLQLSQNNGVRLQWSSFALTIGNTGITLPTVANNITLADSVNIAANTIIGSRIGTAVDQKFGFWNVTPVVQQILATGAGATADNIISLLQTLGLCKQS